MVYWGRWGCLAATCQSTFHWSFTLGEYRRVLLTSDSTCCRLHDDPRVEPTCFFFCRRERHPRPRTPAEMGLVFLHLSDLGYAAYASEINEYYPNEASEYTFIHVQV
jgi:hypothetical protein